MWNKKLIWTFAFTIQICFKFATGQQYGGDYQDYTDDNINDLENGIDDYDNSLQLDEVPDQGYDYNNLGDRDYNNLDERELSATGLQGPANGLPDAKKDVGGSEVQKPAGSEPANGLPDAKKDVGGTVVQKPAGSEPANTDSSVSLDHRASSGQENSINIKETSASGVQAPTNEVKLDVGSAGAGGTGSVLGTGITDSSVSLDHRASSGQENSINIKETSASGVQVPTNEIKPDVGSAGAGGTGSVPGTGITGPVNGSNAGISGGLSVRSFESSPQTLPKGQNPSVPFYQVPGTNFQTYQSYLPPSSCGSSCGSSGVIVIWKPYPYIVKEGDPEEPQKPKDKQRDKHHVKK